MLQEQSNHEYVVNNFKKIFVEEFLVELLELLSL